MLYVGVWGWYGTDEITLVSFVPNIKNRSKSNILPMGVEQNRSYFISSEFREIEKQFPNFRFAVALDNPLPEDNWVLKKDLNDPEGDGFKGFVHNVVIAEYLSKHPAPEEIELYFCGPPMMNQSVIKMADDWGIQKKM